eukprot:TRINITY_DN4439_c0_g1_i1.p1 TRINITY_DN4439_c0_g1~~TRINITY_DN4439_c0_g1_i1.p1  ORF type:complete len:430 (+),score=57.45 TRINITY_DN4439_c0_g1_i1:38-1291(+)
MSTASSCNMEECGSVIVDMASPDYVSDSETERTRTVITPTHFQLDAMQGRGHSRSQSTPATRDLQSDLKHVRDTVVNHERSRTLNLDQQSPNNPLNMVGTWLWFSPPAADDTPVAENQSMLEQMIESAHKSETRPRRFRSEPSRTGHPDQTDSEDEMSSVGGSTRIELDVSDGDCCAMCLCDLDTGICTLNPCGHRFHANCMETYFEKCWVKGCPMCRGDIDSLEDENGVKQTQAQLKSKFKSPCFGIRFRRENYIREGLTSPVTSFFTHASQIQQVSYTEKKTKDGLTYCITIPKIIIELVDSDGNIQKEHDQCNIFMLHSSTTGSITPDIIPFNEGIAELDLACVYKPDAVRPDLLALKFLAQAPGSLVHHKALYAGVRAVATSDRKILLRWALATGIAISVIVTIIGLVLHFTK